MIRNGLLILLASTLAVGGCAHVLSDEARLKIDPLADYHQVRKDPEDHTGKVLMLGGRLVETEVSREGTTLEVVYYTIDRWGRPQGEGSAGRFLALTDQFLDVDTFKAGRLVTMTAAVEGERTLPLKGKDYPYPVFRIDEIHLWRPPDPPYRYPYYYHPYPHSYYDPYWRYPYYHRSRYYPHPWYW